MSPPAWPTTTLPSLNNLDSLNEDAPIVRYANSLIEQAIENRASDLHIEPTEGDLRVRYRIDGVLHEIDTVPRAVQSALISRLKIMANVDITERRVPQNGRITVELGGRSVDLRVATLPTVWGEKIVLRVLDTGGIDLDLKRLGFTERQLRRASRRRSSKPHGMLLVTGPTGSGKSTTLYATLTEISNARGQHHHGRGPGRVSAARRQPGAGQPQGRPDLRRGAAGDPAVGPRHRAHRRDPRPGHRPAGRRGRAHRPPRAVDPAHQRRARRRSPAWSRWASSRSWSAARSTACSPSAWPAGCASGARSPTPRPAPSSTGARWPYDVLEAPTQLWRPVGCRSCANTGYRGRIALHEVMPVSEEIERLTVERASAHEVQRAAIAEGMDMLRIDGLRKAVAGETSLAEVLRVAI